MSAIYAPFRFFRNLKSLLTVNFLKLLGEGGEACVPAELATFVECIVPFVRPKTPQFLTVEEVYHLISQPTTQASYLLLVAPTTHTFIERFQLGKLRKRQCLGFAVLRTRVVAFDLVQDAFQNIARCVESRFNPVGQWGAGRHPPSLRLYPFH